MYNLKNNYNLKIIIIISKIYLNFYIIIKIILNIYNFKRKKWYLEF